MLIAGLGDSFSSFFDAVGSFFSNLAGVSWPALFLALVFFTVYLTLRARASFHILRAAYPDERFAFKRIWGAYFAGYGFNAVIPARGGDVVRLFLTKSSIPNSSYPAVAAAFAVEFIFDLTIAVPVLAYAFSQGVFPKPPDFSSLPAFDLAFFASHPQFTLFFLTVVGIGVLAGFALLSARVRAFWERVRQGLTILRGPAALLPRGLARPVRGLAVPLRGVLVPAGGLPRRRVGLATSCSCWASTRSPRWCRSRRAARACSRRCW